MTWLNNKDGYGVLSIWLHWLMALLIAAVYACMELRENFPAGSDAHKSLETWHFMLGLFVLVLLAIRIAVYLAAERPHMQTQAPKWQAWSAKWMHLALYALMIAMPLLGWLLLSALGEDIPYFGLHLPALIGKSKSAAELLEAIHEVGGTAGYILIGLHTAAALYHHYFVRDNSLRRMLPWRTK